MILKDYGKRLYTISMEDAPNSIEKGLINETLDFVKSDFLPGILNFGRWKALSLRSLRAMNRRAKLGFLWVIMSATVFVVAVSLVYSLVFNIDVDVLLPYIATGYITWALIMSALTSMPILFTTYAAYITQKNLPLTVYVTANAFEKMVVFIAQSLVILVTCCIFKTGVSLALLILPISLTLIFLTAIGASFFIGVAAVRYRDLGQVVNSSLLIIFLLTPIIWKPEFSGKRALIVELNPIYHFIHIIRAPILEHEIPLMSLLVTSGICLSFFLLGFVVMAAYRHRIVFWL